MQSRYERFMFRIIWILTVILTFELSFLAAWWGVTHPIPFVH